MDKYISPKERQRRDRAKMYRLARLITTQEQLNSILLSIAHPHNRGVCFELIKPMLKFKAEYPDHVRRYVDDGIQRKLIL
jgi:hypothetical protein